MLRWMDLFHILHETCLFYWSNQMTILLVANETLVVLRARFGVFFFFLNGDIPAHLNFSFYNKSSHKPNFHFILPVFMFGMGNLTIRQVKPLL